MTFKLYSSAFFVLAASLLAFPSFIRSDPAVTLGNSEITFLASASTVYVGFVDITISTTNKLGWAAVGLGDNFNTADLWVIERTANETFIAARKGQNPDNKDAMPGYDIEQGVTFIKSTTEPLSFTIARPAAARGSKNNMFKNGENSFVWAVYRQAYSKFEDTKPDASGTFNYKVSDTLVPSAESGVMGTMSLANNTPLSAEQIAHGAKRAESQLLAASVSKSANAAAGAVSGAMVNSSGILISIIVFVFMILHH